MCKYCKVHEGIDGEKLNDCKTIETVRDGSQGFELSLNRYVYEPDNTHTSDLIMGIWVDTPHGTYTIKNKCIKIKYCPFCGEEL